MRTISTLGVGVLICGLLVLSAGTFGEAKNGFDLSDTLVPADQIHLGGPPRDGIPAIDTPRFVAPGAAAFLTDDDRVLGLQLNGIAKAYPIKILNWHEVVNDRFGDSAVAVTYCPLCGTGVTFAAGAIGEARRFGVSGLLYNSDVLLYDRATGSLWSQLLMQAVSGPAKGERLVTLPAIHTSWRTWREQHPHTMVLSTDTGFDRDYSVDPYAGYDADTTLYFPVRDQSHRYHPKERVLGIEVDGVAKAYPFAELARHGKATIDDEVNGQALSIHFDAQDATAHARDGAGNLLPGTVSFWFAWYAFHPDTAVFEAAR